jgi:DNA-binding MarR family transcriptional regulator
MPQFRNRLPNLGSGAPVAAPPPATPAEPPVSPGPAAGSGAASGAVSGAVSGAASVAASEVASQRAAPAPEAPAIQAPSRVPGSSLRILRGNQRPFLHMPTLTVPSRAAVESAARELLSGPVEAARHRLQNPRELSDRIAMGRAIWRDLVIGFAAQLGELNLGFTQLAALYALADSGTMTVADLADTLGRSQSAASRLVDGLVQRQLIERNQDSEDRRLRTLTLTGRGQALLGIVDRARAQEFLSIVRPLPTAERALVAMGVAALSTHAISRRGHLIKQRPPR